MARPQKLTDMQILEAVALLRDAGRPWTGVDVRRELSRRFGARAGTDRLYRLIKASALHDRPPLPAPDIDSRSALRERDEALRRAHLAEYREETSQERSAREIDALRQRLKALGVDPFASDAGGRSVKFPV